MNQKLISSLQNIRSYELGYISFLFGIFFLPSALPIAGIFLLFSLIVSYMNQEVIFFKGNPDFPFFISIFLILISTLKITIFNIPEELVNFNKSTIWFGLFNWIPILLFYFGFKFYLKNDNSRILFKNVLIAGSIPVLTSCILQKFFNIYGPFQTLFGSIVWFNKPLNINDENFMGGLTGLFSNPNYLGTWLTMLIPFLIASLKEKSKNIRKNIFLYFLNFLAIYFALLTNSRNAVIAIIISLLLMFNIRKNYKQFLVFGGLALFATFVPIFLDISKENFMEVSKYNLIKKFITEKPILDSLRILIWKDTLSLIFERPFWGWGSGTYYYITSEKTKDLFLNGTHHSHNIILEIAYNFGIPTALMITITSLKIFFIAFKKVFILNLPKFNNSLNKAWITSVLVFLLIHFNDITYYDGKISILFCILFAGLNKIVKQQNYHEKEIKNL